MDVITCLKNEHPFPYDLLKTVTGWRFASGYIHTDKFRHPSRYYYVEINTVRCQVCGATFNKILIWQWHRDGLTLAFKERDEEFYPKLKQVVWDKFSKRLVEYGVIL